MTRIVTIHTSTLDIYLIITIKIMDRTAGKINRKHVEYYLENTGKYKDKFFQLFSPTEIICCYWQVHDPNLGNKWNRLLLHSDFGTCATWNQRHLTWLYKHRKGYMQMHMVTQKQRRTVVDSPQKGIRTHMQTHMPTHKVQRMTCHVGWPEKFSHVEREREQLN